MAAAIAKIPKSRNKIRLRLITPLNAMYNKPIPERRDKTEKKIIAVLISFLLIAPL